MSDTDMIAAGDTQDSEERKLQIAETRAEHLQRVAEGYEVYDEGMPDSTTPGAAVVEGLSWARPGEAEQFIPRKHPRYVLVTQHGGNYRLYLGEDVANIEQLAAQAVTDSAGGELVYCYFDLDELVGAEPRPFEGDRVRLTEEGKAYAHLDNSKLADAEFWVVGSETDVSDGEAYERLYLSTERDADYFSGEYDVKVDECYVTVVERAEPDERMPRRYGVAKVITHVVFNTIPTEA